MAYQVIPDKSAANAWNIMEPPRERLMEMGTLSSWKNSKVELETTRRYEKLWKSLKFATRKTKKKTIFSHRDAISARTTLPCWNAIKHQNQPTTKNQNWSWSHYQWHVFNVLLNQRVLHKIRCKHTAMSTVIYFSFVRTNYRLQGKHMSRV